MTHSQKYSLERVYRKYTVALTFEIFPKGVFWSGCPVGWCSLTKSNGTLLEVEFAGKLSILDPLLTPMNMVKVDTQHASTVVVDPKPTLHGTVDSPRTRESGTNNHTHGAGDEEKLSLARQPTNSSTNSSQLSTIPIIFDCQVRLEPGQQQVDDPPLPLPNLAPDKELNGRNRTHSDKATNSRPQPTPTPNTPTPIKLTPMTTNSSARIPQPRLRASKQLAAAPQTTPAVSDKGGRGILGWFGLVASTGGPAAAARAGGGALPPRPQILGAFGGAESRTSPYSGWSDLEEQKCIETQKSPTEIQKRPNGHGLEDRVSDGGGGGDVADKHGRRSRDSSPMNSTQQAVTQLLSPRLRDISTVAGLPAREHRAECDGGDSGGVRGGVGGGRGGVGAPYDAGATSLQKRRHAMQTQNGPRNARLQALLTEVHSLYCRSLLSLQ